MPVSRRFLLAALLLGAVLLGDVQAARAQAAGSARLKDVVLIEGALPVQLTGYGLVVGLDRTGDRARGQRGAPYTVQSIANMLQQFGIAVDPALLATRNAAAVMVTTRMDPFSGPGTTIDVTVSALGDARSLSGGVLLQTPLTDPTTGQVLALAQGPVSTGAVEASSRGSSVRINYTNTARIPNGAIVREALPITLNADAVGLLLKRPDFTNAVRVAGAVNAAFPDAAEVVHAGLVRVTVPEEAGGSPALLADLEALTVDVDLPARVVINERTGTIVAGGNVRINEVMVTYGNVIVSTEVDPFVSQPPPFSEGETVTGAAGAANVEEEQARSVVLGPSADVGQLAASLNELGLSARDVVAIFQAIDQAGALQGELVIL